METSHLKPEFSYDTIGYFDPSGEVKILKPEAVAEVHLKPTQKPEGNTSDHVQPEKRQP